MGGKPEATARIRLRHDKEHAVTLPCGRLLRIVPQKKNGRFTIEITTANGGAIVVRTRKRA